jgi:hypothetical protein
MTFEEKGFAIYLAPKRVLCQSIPIQTTIFLAEHNKWKLEKRWFLDSMESSPHMMHE